MSLATIFSRGRQGIHSPLVTVEVHISNGLPSLSIVGLPETAVKESKDRVRGAIQNSQFKFPSSRMTVNLAPADLPKDGGRFDLPIALGILAASRQINNDSLDTFECAGELSLGGELRAISGALPVALATGKADRMLIIPSANAQEAALATDAQVLAANHLLEVCAHINGQRLLSPAISTPFLNNSKECLDFQDVHGQYHVKRAFEVAAAGAHNLLMLGPPGTGKSMTAARLPTILPPLTEAQALETAAIASISELGLKPELWRQPPFRSPHHTASAPALVGGGNNPKPGEISLAHNGTLFLDELPEFDRKVLEVLREPLETGHVTISRANHRAEFPARFQLIAAMNPCPCGYLGDQSGRCHCTQDHIKRYRSRISGPLLDRIDIHIEVPRVSHLLLRDDQTQAQESSSTIRTRVINARNRALSRCGKQNAVLTPQELQKYCPITREGHQLLEEAVNKLGLSHRAYHRIIKLARTIADLGKSEAISIKHLSEAIGYRRLDRKNY